MLERLLALLALFGKRQQKPAEKTPPEPIPAPPEPETKPEAPEQPEPPKSALATLIGVTAAALLVPLVQQWEGTKTVPYKDVVGIWTVCTGDTKDVDPTRTYTKQECEERLEQQLIAHAKPVLECVPGLKDKPDITAASVSLAYNIGPAAFCRSTIATKFRQGDWRGGCDGFLAWRFAGGREIKGLKNRREAEREICLRDT